MRSACRAVLPTRVLCGGVPCRAVARTGWAGTAVQRCDDGMRATRGIARRAREGPSQSLAMGVRYSPRSCTAHGRDCRGLDARQQRTPSTRRIVQRNSWRPNGIDRKNVHTRRVRCPPYRRSIFLFFDFSFLLASSPERRAHPSARKCAVSECNGHHTAQASTPGSSLEALR